jgi:hypothetical protein
MSLLNWNNLRPWGGSQHSAFEELCCQLAANEPAPPGAEYRRVGAPDAGVECIWRDPNGSIRAWQAKFFTRPPNAGEWQQIDKSVRQAIAHYSDLVVYAVCLPIDRPDARLRGRKSMMDRWDSGVAKWTAQARAEGRRVAFQYWGEHEIIARLTRAEHAGRRYFWFSSHVLGPTWFRDHFETARANVGARYTPELHVGLEISTVLDALARHPRFLERIQHQWGVARREVARAIPNLRRAGGTGATNTTPPAERAVDSHPRSQCLSQ